MLTASLAEIESRYNTIVLASAGTKNAHGAIWIIYICDVEQSGFPQPMFLTAAVASIKTKVLTLAADVLLSLQDTLTIDAKHTQRGGKTSVHLFKETIMNESTMQLARKSLASTAY